ncbi:MAG: hypothetical protein ABIC36_03580 [bacterium]
MLEVKKVTEKKTDKEKGAKGEKFFSDSSSMAPPCHPEGGNCGHTKECQPGTP